MPGGFAAIGGMAMFSGIAGAIGTIATGVVVSAVVGAAVGGIAAAVMGGDIGKGMLFGAIGGVVTGGIAGQGISGLFTGAAPTYTSGASGSMFMEGASITSLGEGGGVMATQAATKTAATGAGSASGSFIKDIAIASAPEMVKGIGAGLLAGADKKSAAAPKQTAVRSGGGGGGGSSGPSLADQLALMEAEDKGKMARLIKEGQIGDRQIGLKSEAALKEMAKDYELAKDKSAFEFGQEWDKQKATAAGAAKSEYQSGEGAYEAVLAAQEARGDAGSGRENTQVPSGGALVGPEEEEAMA